MTPGGSRLVLLGDGRMARAVGSLAEQHGFTVAGRFGRSALEREPDAVRAALTGADVAIEFTAPEGAARSIGFCLDAACPVVVGTTGWLDHLPAIRERVSAAGGSMLWSPNFSVGAALLKAILRRSAPLIARTGTFDAHIVETHHAGKLDSPSGTALMLAEALGSSPPITSVRTGHVPGTHDVMLEGRFEALLLRHQARDRRVFADGALRAARWLPGYTGVFTMDDMIHDEMDELEA